MLAGLYWFVWIYWLCSSSFMSVFARSQAHERYAGASAGGLSRLLTRNNV